VSNVAGGRGERRKGWTYLDGQGRLAHTAVAEHHQLVQRHFSRHGVGLDAEAVQRGGECRERNGSCGGGLLSSEKASGPSEGVVQGRRQVVAEVVSCGLARR
jgi:hypothetical protein